LAASGQKVSAEVAQILAEAHAGEADYAIGQMTFEVFLVRAVGPASGAAALMGDPAIFLVDSETAVTDHYSDLAARVRVIHMPSVPDEIRWEAGE
jgi:hypothetical protein